MSQEYPSENLRPLSQEDIIRLGKITGIHVLSLPDEFAGSSEAGERALDQIVDELSLEVIAATNTQLAEPEEFDDQV